LSVREDVALRLSRVEAPQDVRMRRHNSLNVQNAASSRTLPWNLATDVADGTAEMAAQLLQYLVGA